MLTAQKGKLIMRRILTSAAIFAAVMICVPVAGARNIESVKSGDWDALDTWQLVGGGAVDPKPGADDSVTVKNTHEVDVRLSAEYADNITVQSGGTVDIEQTCSLTLDGSTSATSYVSGTGVIHLENSGSILRFTSNSHTISFVTSAGAIQGDHNSANIEIAGSKTVTSYVTIAGALQIVPVSGESNTMFLNRGTVQADRSTASSVLKVAVTTLNYCNCGTAADGDWSVSHANSTLRFDVSSTALQGDFTVSAGTLDINSDITTCGSLTQTGGVIDVAAGRVFRTD